MVASMPSPLGHALAGVAVALAGNRAPASSTLRRFLLHPLTLWSVALAALPDADLLLPGFHRTVTHSVSTSIAVIIVAMVVYLLLHLAINGFLRMFVVRKSTV